MKVLLINGSPHEKGCTWVALHEMETTFKEEGIETELIQVGHKDIRGCIACGRCRESGKCIFNDAVNEVSEKLKEADGLVLGSPVYYSSPNGTMVAFLDRLFQSCPYDLTMKTGASVVTCRRAGNTASFDVLNKYFTISGMPVAASYYWNNIHGFTAEDALKDREGLQTMRNLARNMAFLIRSISLGRDAYGLPKRERTERTSFPDGLE